MIKMQILKKSLFTLSIICITTLYGSHFVPQQDEIIIDDKFISPVITEETPKGLTSPDNTERAYWLQHPASNYQYLIKTPNKGYLSFNTRTGQPNFSYITEEAKSKKFSVLPYGLVRTKFDFDHQNGPVGEPWKTSNIISNRPWVRSIDRSDPKFPFSKNAYFRVGNDYYQDYNPQDKSKSIKFDPSTRTGGWGDQPFKPNEIRSMEKRVFPSFSPTTGTGFAGLSLSTSSFAPSKQQVTSQPQAFSASVSPSSSISQFAPSSISPSSSMQQISPWTQTSGQLLPSNFSTQQFQQFQPQSMPSQPLTPTTSEMPQVIQEFQEQNKFQFPSSSQQLSQQTSSLSAQQQQQQQLPQSTLDRIKMENETYRNAIKDSMKRSWSPDLGIYFNTISTELNNRLIYINGQIPSTQFQQQSPRLAQVIKNIFALSQDLVNTWANKIPQDQQYVTNVGNTLLVTLDQMDQIIDPILAAQKSSTPSSQPSILPQQQPQLQISPFSSSSQLPSSVVPTMVPTSKTNWQDELNTLYNKINHYLDSLGTGSSDIDVSILDDVSKFLDNSILNSQTLNLKNPSTGKSISELIMEVPKKSNFDVLSVMPSAMVKSGLSPWANVMNKLFQKSNLPISTSATTQPLPPSQLPPMSSSLSSQSQSFSGQPLTSSSLPVISSVVAAQTLPSKIGLVEQVKYIPLQSSKFSKLKVIYKDVPELNTRVSYGAEYKDFQDPAMWYNNPEFSNERLPRGLFSFENKNTHVIDDPEMGESLAVYPISPITDGKYLISKRAFIRNKDGKYINAKDRTPWSHPQYQQQIDPTPETKKEREQIHYTLK